MAFSTSLYNFYLLMVNSYLFLHYNSNPNSTFSELDTWFQKTSTLYLICQVFILIKLILFIINAGNFFRRVVRKLELGIFRGEYQINKRLTSMPESLFSLFNELLSKVDSRIHKGRFSWWFQPNIYNVCRWDEFTKQLCMWS